MSDNPLGYLALTVGWFIPGVAHCMIGQKKRGLLFAVTIHLLFAAGLFLGGIRAIRPAEQPIWTYTQYLAGWPMLVSTVVQTKLSILDAQEQERRRLLPSYVHSQTPPVAYLPVDYAPKTQDVGSVYCGIAGMLNLLVLFDALVRVAGGHVSQRESVGEAGQAAGGGAK